MNAIRKQYIRPNIIWIPVDGETLLADVSGGNGRMQNGWTTSDPLHGDGITEEDPDNPFDDADFG